MSVLPAEAIQPASGCTWRGSSPWTMQDETRRLLQRALTAMGYEVETANDGIEALAKLPLGTDLVLLDARMPGLDGFEVARRIRADPAYSDLPIIMLTGLDSREDRVRAIEAGVNDFIAKPFELTELRVRTESLLRLKEATDALKRHHAELEQTVAKRTADLRLALDGMVAAQRSTFAAHLDTIRRLVIAAEYKDRDTAAHIERIGLYCELVATASTCRRVRSRSSATPARCTMWARSGSPMRSC